MSDSSLYLALREGSQASQRRDTTIRWVKGRVVDTSKTDPTLPAGWVRVGMPYDKPETYVAGETPGLVDPQPTAEVTGTAEPADPAQVGLVVVAVPPTAIADAVGRALRDYPGAVVTDAAEISAESAAALRDLSASAPLLRADARGEVAGVLR